MKAGVAFRQPKVQILPPPPLVTVIKVRGRVAMEELTIFDFIWVVMFWLSPLIFLEGVFILLAADKYKNVENKLNTELGWFGKKKTSKLEVNIYTFHDWLFKKRVVIGIVLITYSVVSFVMLKKYYPY